MTTDLNSVDLSKFADYDLEHYDWQLPEGWREWDQALFDAYRAYAEGIDPEEYEYNNSPYAARMGIEKEEEFFVQRQQSECCGWHEEVIQAVTSVGVVDLRVGFSYGH